MNQTHKIRVGLCLSIVVFSCLFIYVLHKTLEHHPPVKVGILMALCFGGLYWIVSSPKFFDRFVGESSAESLAGIRILVCSIMLGSVLFLHAPVHTVMLPESIIQPMGVMQIFYLFPGAMELTRSETFLESLKWLTALFLFFAAIGFRTRYSITIGLLFFLFMGGVERQYSYLNHQGLILIDLLFVLLFTPCSDALSIDSYIKHRTSLKNQYDQHVKRAVYGWSRYICWTTFAASYAVAGMSKLRVGGLLWWEPLNLRHKLYWCSLNPCDNFGNFTYALNLVHAPDIIFALFGILGVFGEIAFLLVLFFKPIRLVFPLAMIFMHVGIYFFQNVLFFDFALLNLMFFDFSWLLVYLRRKIRKSQLNQQLEQSEFNRFTKQRYSNNKTISAYFYSSFLCSILIILNGLWYYQFKFYPLTSWSVFADRNSSGVIVYYKLLARADSEEYVLIYPEKLPYDFLYNAYKNSIKGCFSDESEELARCQDHFDVFPTIYNRHVGAEESINGFKLEKWQWNFVDDANSESYGVLTDTYVHEL